MVSSAAQGDRADAPRSRAIQQLLEEHQPDVVLLTSLTFSRILAMDQ
jgi:hypothetical protein